MIRFGLIAFLMITGCGLSGSPEPSRTGLVVLPDQYVVEVELALTPRQQARGLMYRRELPMGKGMLFVYPDDDLRAIWMKNCFIALDLLWLSAEGRILHVEERVPPCDLPGDECPSYIPLQLSRYVLELPAGSVERHGLKPNDQLQLMFDGKSIPPASSRH